MMFKKTRMKLISTDPEIESLTKENENVFLGRNLGSLGLHTLILLSLLKHVTPLNITCIATSSNIGLKNTFFFCFVDKNKF